MTKIYEIAEQAAEHAVLNYSGEVLQSETEDTKIQIPKEFVDKFSELIVRRVIERIENWAEDDFGLNALAIEILDEFDMELKDE